MPASPGGITADVILDAATAAVVAAATTTYLGPGGNQAAAATCPFIAPNAGMLYNFNVYLSAAPGGALTTTGTVFVNGVATALTVSITAAATQAQDLVHSVTVPAGALIAFQVITPTGAVSAFVSANVLLRS